MTTVLNYPWPPPEPCIRMCTPQGVEQRMDEVRYCIMALVPCVLSSTFRPPNHRVDPEMTCGFVSFAHNPETLTWSPPPPPYPSLCQARTSLSSQIIVRLLVVRSRPISYKSKGMVNTHQISQSHRFNINHRNSLYFYRSKCAQRALVVYLTAVNRIYYASYRRREPRALQIHVHIL